jgi:DNA-binding NtrC family response regulator
VVLIVEACPEMQEHFERFLAGDVDLVMVRDMQTAVRIIKNRQFDLVLYDIETERECEAVIFLNQLRSLGAYASMPVVAILGYLLPDGKEMLQQASFDARLPKPFTLRRLREVVRRCIVRRTIMALNRS